MNDSETIQKLIQQTKGGRAALLQFCKKTLSLSPGELKPLEVTYFALSVNSIFFLQFSSKENKNELLDEAARSILARYATSNGTGESTDQTFETYRKRLTEYGELIAKLLAKKADGTPIVELLTSFYKRVTGVSAEKQVLPTGKAGKILSQYIIDTIKFAQLEFNPKD